jgi:hypothetical protein
MSRWLGVEATVDSFLSIAREAHCGAMQLRGRHDGASLTNRAAWSTGSDAPIAAGEVNVGSVPVEDSSGCRPVGAATE